MKLQFIGANHEVTGSCHYLQAGDSYMLVDYGMEQGVNRFENCPLPVPESQINFVFLTHAHIDHSGMLPLLYAHGFRGKIYTTEATADLCSIMLRDCAHIQQQEAEWKSRKAKRHAGIEVEEPLYTMEDAIGTINCIVPCPYGKELEINDNVTIRFTDVGHLLGSASIEVWLKEEGCSKKTCFFRGYRQQKPAADKRSGHIRKTADYVVMESTYGDRLHAAVRARIMSES